MKRYSVLKLLPLILLINSCDVEEVINELNDPMITAKEKMGEVLNKARADFSSDAQLSAIYGWNVNSEGKIDLQKPGANAFVYTVQSDSKQSNEFYVPVFGTSPVQSPINFNSMLSFIKDAQAKSILESVFGKLATINIDASVGYADSPEVLNKMFARSDVITFRTNNSTAKTDMFLVPSKSIDTTSVNNAADWIVNFYADTSSLVLWLHPGTVNGTIDIISN
jgi:hypothetical protein